MLSVDAALGSSEFVAQLKLDFIPDCSFSLF